MILGITGHRPKAIGGFKIPNPIYSYIMLETEKIICEHRPEKIITGMCIGYDHWVAELALKLHIPFVAAVPFIGQELLWPPEVQVYYRNLLSKADQMVVVSPGGFASWKMQARNQWIVNNSDVLLAAFSGKQGGTYNCVEYAKAQNKIIKIINPFEAKL